ncbi:MAG TPA: PfkB family carbohydrate kinase [Actinospica sp.]|jgi:rfaE bifunctional protein nucleotidyltransferase chain/domain/rfaE bifunctional protein kinase chain/domain|nr:PfkB family carbohydrate kinase [Actinospica sp.]
MTRHARTDGPLLVVGDALLDRDLDGPVTRLAPDAPAPVVENPTSRVRPGGAALTALLAARTGREVVLLSPIGEDDPASRELRRLLDGRVRLVPLPLAGAPAEKIRIRTRGRTLVRVDRGGGACGEPGPEAVAAIRDAAAVLVSDYGGGTSAQPALRALLAERAQSVPLLWDPHPRGADPVPGTLLATPNAAEALNAAGVRKNDPDAAAHAARRLLETWPVAGLCVTLGEEGALLAFNGGSPLLVPAPQVTAADTCGAGDAFAAALALALSEGELPSPAVARAVAEAAAFVQAGGAAALTGPDAAPSGPAPESAAGKPGSVGAALAAVQAARARGARIVATGGCFDVLHAGHLDCLRSARALGDFLVVCVNSDASVRRLKGRGRPVNTVADRAALLAAFDCVDAVAVFGEDDPSALLDRIRPDLWVKGGDYSGRELPEAALVASWGGRAVTVPYLNNHSSTLTLSALEQAARPGAAVPGR